MNVHQKVGASIREIRTHNAMSLSQLAESSGVSKSVISTLENGKRDVGLKTLERLANPLGFHIWEILKHASTQQ